MTTVITTGEVVLNGVRYPIKGPVRRGMVSAYPPKVVIGDTGRDTHSRTSIVSLTNWPGGIGLDRFRGNEGDTSRVWWSTCNMRHQALTLPPLAMQTADQSVAGTYTVILGEYFEGGEMVIYAAFGTSARKYDNDGDSWGSELHALPSEATDSLTRRIGSTTYLFFATTSGYTYYDASTWVDDIKDTKYLAYHDGALWGIDANGSLWTQTTLGVQESESGTVSADETDGSAEVDDTGAVFDSTIRGGDHWLRITDASGNSLTGYIGTGDPDGDDTKVNIYESTNRSVQNWIEGDGTAFDETDTPLTYNVYKEATTKAQLPLPDGFVTDLFVSRKSDGEMGLYAMTKNGLWIYDQTNDRWLETELGLPRHPRAGRGSARWRDSTFIPAGLSVYQYQTASTGAAVALVGPDRDAGLPEAQRGEIKKLEGSHNELLALADGATEPVAFPPVSFSHGIKGDGGMGGAFPALDAAVVRSGPSVGSGLLLGWDGAFWNTKWLSPSDTGTPPDDIIVSDAYGQYRAWWVFDQRVWYMDLPTSIINPSQISGHEYGASGTHEYPWFDADDESTNKLALRLVGTAEDMTDDETAVLKYILDYGVSEVTVGTISSDGEFTFDLPDSATPEGVEFRAIRPIIDLSRGASNTKSSPKIRNLELLYRKKLPLKWGFEAALDTGRTYGGRSPLELRQAIITAAESGTLVQFNYRDEGQEEQVLYVDVVGVQGLEQTGRDHGAEIVVQLAEN